MRRTRDGGEVLPGSPETFGSVKLTKAYVSVNILTILVILSLGFRMLGKRERVTSKA